MDLINNLITLRVMRALWGIFFLYAFLAITRCSINSWLYVTGQMGCLNAAQISTLWIAFVLDTSVFILKCVFLFSLKPSKIIMFLNQSIKKEINNV